MFIKLVQSKIVPDDDPSRWPDRVNEPALPHIGRVAVKISRLDADNLMVGLATVAADMARV
jgi:hypothetical protein